jgi:hypothetical protein
METADCSALAFSVNPSLIKGSPMLANANPVNNVLCIVFLIRAGSFNG